MSGRPVVRTGLRVAVAAAVASVCAHVLLTWVLPSRDGSDAPDYDVVELEMDIARPAPSPPDVVSGRAAAATPVRVATPVERQAGLRVRRSSSTIVLPPSAPATIDVAALDTPAPAAACDVPQPTLVIDPRAAALAGMADEAGGTTMDQVLGRSLANGLAREANAHSWSTHREPPDLRPARDGGYDYRGPRFSAHIAPDGTVHFADADAVSVHGPGDGTSSILSGNFDIGEAAMAASGQDPLAPERAWFMRETEDVRIRLDARARHADGEASLRELSRRLAAIIASTRLTPAQQRERVFDTWDDCETDVLGDRARATILGFAREHFPEGTALAYTAAELSALNARRSTHERFDPYRG